MRIWSIGTNSYYKTASYILREAPWHIYALEKIDFLIERGVSKLPSFIWEWWYIHIFDRIFQWCTSKEKAWWVHLDYDSIKDKHPKIWRERRN